MITFVNTVPIDDKRSINRFCLIRNFALWPAFDSYARKVRCPFNCMRRRTAEAHVCFAGALQMLGQVHTYCWQLVQVVLQ